LDFLLAFIRSGFYRDCPDRWFKDQHFIRRKVLTYPAKWLNSRGVTLPTDRYKEILVGIFSTIKVHGQTDTVRYWPGYLLHCVQTHFKCHGDEIYEEGKSIRAHTDLALATVQRALQAQRVADPVASLVQVANALKVATRKKKVSDCKAQMSLF
jgi:hypothetical protein